MLLRVFLFGFLLVSQSHAAPAAEKRDRHIIEASKSQEGPAAEKRDRHIIEASQSQEGPVFRRRYTDIEALYGLTRLTEDHSGKAGDPQDKYFHESTFHPHYDGRFAEHVLWDTSERRAALTALIQTYLSTMHDLGAETWIMHGSLLGWWWNRKIMPWDSDVDVQVSERSIEYLAKYYNMTVHHFKIPGNGKTPPQERNYMLEVNPHYENGSQKDKLNVIDARWIDTHTGLFIDITTLRRNRTAEAEGKKGYMICKDKHHYMENEIYPLRDSVFEGMPVKIPYAYSALLEEEYGPSALTNTYFERHQFDRETMEWVPIDPVFPDWLADLDAADPVTVLSLMWTAPKPTKSVLVKGNLLAAMPTQS